MTDANLSRLDERPSSSSRVTDPSPRTSLRVILFFVAAGGVLASPLWLAPTSFASSSPAPAHSGGTCDGGAN